MRIYENIWFNTRIIVRSLSSFNMGLTSNIGGKEVQTNLNKLLEESALRQHGILGRGCDMGNTLPAMAYDLLPPEGKQTIELIIKGGPFPCSRDGTNFGNRFGDLPSKGEYL